MQKSVKKKVRKPQSQHRPGDQFKMKPEPVFNNPAVRGSGKLNGKVAVITGGDSGIGRAIAVLFAKEGADIALLYFNEHEDANETKRIVEEEWGKKCLLIAGDIAKESFCTSAIKKIARQFKVIHILINNAGMHYEKDSIKEITAAQLYKIFETNVFSMFYLTKAALGFIPEGGSVINTTSVTAYRGSAKLLDYSATKGAIVSFTRSLSANLLDKKIRVNAVAPGPIWTPLIAASYTASKVATFGTESPMKRAGQPVEVAPAYLFLACDDSSYISGQVLHPNGGEIVNG
jgi:NAD(P)-dependent dehydrogenase (short-subunit alcohol dehydrogenase family)